MYRVVRCSVVLAGLLVLPSLALAQASISGVVRDTSGAVLPGVTVEAASPVLIEKVRTAVTDNNGRYQMIDLRPGAYTVTFTLAGFNTGKRDGRRPQRLGGIGRRHGSACRLAGRDDHRDGRGADRGRLDDVAFGRPERRHHRRAADFAQLRQPGADDSGRRLQRHRRRRLAAAGRRRQRPDPRQPAAGPARDAQRHQHDDAAGGRQHRRADSGRGIGH